MKLSIISGGSKGLGAALLDYYRERKYEVIEFSRTGTSECNVRLDISQPEVVLRTLPAIFEKYRSMIIDEIIYYNNAGILSPIGVAADKSPDEILSNINTNISSAILFMNEYINSFQEKPCKKIIANISSGAAQRGYNGWSLYCAAKAGIENFIRSVSLEQKDKKYPIVAINVDPGIIDTDMQKLIRETAEVDFPEKQRFVEYKKSKTLVEPKIVAEKIAMIVDGNIKGGRRYKITEIKKR